MNSFNKKIIWITGASSGIGEALSLALAQQDAALILSARRQEELKRVQALCLHHTHRCVILPLDLQRTETFAESVIKAKSFFGGIDILINNGGIAQRGAAKDMALHLEREIMEINFFSAIALSKMVLPVMISQGGGTIVVMSSLMGRVGMPYASTYAASKHAMNGYFEAMASEVEPENVKVKIIMPGYVRTAVSINAITSEGQKHGKMDKGQEEGMLPEVLAQKILPFLISDKREIILGGRETYILTMKKWLPFLFYRTTRNIALKMRKKYGY